MNRRTLIGAVAGVAAAPMLNRVGSAQNGPRVPMSPTAATVSAIMLGTGDTR